MSVALLRSPSCVLIAGSSQAARGGSLPRVLIAGGSQAARAGSLPRVLIAGGSQAARGRVTVAAVESPVTEDS